MKGPADPPSSGASPAIAAAIATAAAAAATTAATAAATASAAAAATTTTATAAAAATTAAAAGGAAEAAATTTTAAGGAAEAAATTTAPAATAGSALARLVDGQGAAIEILAVQRIDGGLSLLIAGDVNEAEATRLARHSIGHDLDTERLDPCALERSAHAVLGGMECQIPHVQSLAHLTDSPVHDLDQRIPQRSPGS